MPQMGWEVAPSAGTDLGWPPVRPRAEARWPGRSPVDRGKQGTKRSEARDNQGIPGAGTGPEGCARHSPVTRPSCSARPSPPPARHHGTHRLRRHRFRGGRRSCRFRTVPFSAQVLAGRRRPGTGARGWCPTRTLRPTGHDGHRAAPDDAAPAAVRGCSPGRRRVGEPSTEGLTPRTAPAPGRPGTLAARSHRRARAQVSAHADRVYQRAERPHPAHRRRTLPRGRANADLVRTLRTTGTARWAPAARRPRTTAKLSGPLRRPPPPPQAPRLVDRSMAGLLG